MGDWYIGEIRAFSFPWAPQGWALCNGDILQITGNQALFSLLGTAFGGNGQTTFGLPDLRGRICLPENDSNPEYLRGKTGGAETVALTTATIPAHNHGLYAVTAAGTVAGAKDNLFATVAPNAAVPTAQPLYGTPAYTTSLVPLNTASISNAFPGVAHNNIQPSLVTNFCIAITGVYPPRN